ncbi:hypothetical protein T440DRAFT_461098 [Plenodomus tracheiphilus IPT5]|uniref:Uncharacterized protein n=1 Tax=Plenodomus tracheiphilus IPT5 TaxID=1408161 RepID=A0A6A7AS89_9PLEO|nr:hypothetical protein T440DRAFT_461098 [Plenodomus tracheiphilus IPT5]
MCRWYLFLLLAVAWCVGAFQLSSEPSHEDDVIQAAFDNASAHLNHLESRDYVRFDPSIVAIPRTWNTAVLNGHYLSCIMRRPDRDAGKILRDTRAFPSAVSLFSGPYSEEERTNLLKRWGWYELPREELITYFSRYWGWRDAIRSLEWPISRSSTTAVRLLHADPDATGALDTQHFSGPDGNFYWSTGARASFVLNHSARLVFIAQWYTTTKAFEAAQKHTPSLGDLPSLRLLSDLLWLWWQRRYADTTRQIKYFAVARITSTTGQQIIASALQKRGHTDLLPLWPGITFARDEEAGRALIGSLGMSCAQFLFTHKHALGVKHIYKAVVFRDSHNNWYPHVIFYVEDIPADIVIPPETPDWQPYPTNAPGAASVLEDRAVGNLGRPYERDGDGNYFRVHNLTMG